MQGFAEFLGMEAERECRPLQVVCYRDKTGEIAVYHRKMREGSLPASQVKGSSQNLGADTKR